MFRKYAKQFRFKTGQDTVSQINDNKSQFMQQIMANLAKRRNPMREIALKALQKQGMLQQNKIIEPKLVTDDETNSFSSDGEELQPMSNQEQISSSDSEDITTQQLQPIINGDEPHQIFQSDDEDLISQQPMINVDVSEKTSSDGEDPVIQQQINILSSSDGEISDEIHNLQQKNTQQQQEIQQQLNKQNVGITFDSSQKQKLLLNPQKFMQEMLAKLEGHQTLQQNIQKIALKNKSDAEKLKKQSSQTTSTADQMRFNKKMPPIPKGCGNDWVLQEEEEEAALLKEEEELERKNEFLQEEQEEEEEVSEQQLIKQRKHLVVLDIQPNKVMVPPQKFYLIENLNTLDPRDSFYQDPTVVGEHLFHVNTLELYYSSIDNVPSHRSMENIWDGIKLIDIFDFEKDTTENCCNNIFIEIQAGDISQVIYEHKENQSILKPFDLPFKVCLRINTNKIWKLCLLQDSEYHILKEWKSILDQLVIFAAQEQKPDQIQDQVDEEKESQQEDNKEDIPFFVDYKHLYTPAQKFQIAMQRSEQCQDQVIDFCNKPGLSPSPVNLGYDDNFDKQTFISENSLNNKLVFNYDKTTNATIQYQDNESWIHGNFGHLIHEFQDQIKTFEAYKILVVSPSEHTINGFTFDAEILIYHKSLQNEEAILSLMVMAQDDGIPNVFLERMKPEFWPPAISNSPYKIEAKESTRPDVNNDIDLKNLFSHNSKCMTYFDPSFFWYQGGDTRDGCKEPIERYVIMRPIKVSTIQLAAVIEYGFNHQIFGNSNAKDIQDLGDRKVIYSIDTCTNQYGTFGEMEERQAVFDSEEFKREKFQDILAEAVKLNDNKVTKDILAQSFEIVQQYKPLNTHS